MPFVPSVGVPFVVTRLVGEDGATITVTATVTDTAGRFTVTVVNTSTRSTEVSLQLRDGGAAVTVTVPSGVTELAVPGARRWDASWLSLRSA